MEIKSGQLNYPNNQYYFSSRLMYVFQLNIARKFSEKFSMQVNPVIIHKNMVATRNDNNTMFALGSVLRYKLSRRLSVIGEASYLMHKKIYSKVNNRFNKPTLSGGIAINTGKHDIQIFVSNATAMNESSILTQTTEQWKNGEIHFGFNIGRIFNVINSY